MGTRGRWVAGWIAAIGALGFVAISTAGPSVSGVSVKLVDAKNHSDGVSGSPATAAPGSVVALAVSATLASGDKWYTTSWSIGSGTATCANTGDHTSSGSPTEYIEVTLPETTPSSAKVTVQLFGDTSCSGSPLANASTDVKIGTPTANGTLLAHCDTRIALVLDQSGSIGSTPGAAAAVRNGAKAFANGLVGTGAELAVVGFSSTGATVPLGTPPTVYNTITDAFVNGPFTSYINNTYNPSGWTNWQDALDEVSALTPLPELVVFLTDGDPTARNTASGPETNFPDGSYDAMNPAFLEANALKTKKVHIFMMGVGAALTQQDSLVRLRALSGPKQFPQNGLIDSDYTVISNFQQLQDALAVIGRALCSVTVNVTKLVDPQGDGTYAPGNGWNFSGTVTTSGTSNDSYRWLAPGIVGGPPSGGNERTAATVDDFSGNPGHLAFAWKTSPTSLTSQIVLADKGKPGYHFAGVSCTRNGAALDVPSAATVTIGGLTLNDTAACVFKNQLDRGEIKVVKKFIGQPVRVSLLIDNEIKKTSNEQTFATDVVKVGAGSHEVSEQFDNEDVTALYTSSYSCTKGSSVVREGKGVLVAGGVPIANGDSVTCTFTNEKKGIATLVSKTADPNVLDEPGGAVKFTIEVVNKTDAPVTLTKLHDNVFGDLDANSPADQHSWTTSDCQTGVPLAAYNGEVGGEDTYSCSFAGNVAGQGSTTHKDTVTGTITDASGASATETATAAVDITDVAPAIAVTKTVTPNRVQDSGIVTYTAVITNTSPVDALNVDQLTDSIYGNLISGPVKASCTLGGVAVALPHELPVGESLICTFRVTVSATQTNTLTASGTDAEGTRVQDADAAIVVVGHTPPPTPTPPPEPPPPPVPPSPEPVPADVDLTVTKTAPETVYLNSKVRASFDYTIHVSTAGPAPSTTLSDKAPKGTRFVRIVRQPNQGSCSLANAGRVLVCNLGNLVAGQSVDLAVRLAVAATAGPKITNTATANCKPDPPVACTDAGTASTRVLAPFLPPRGCSTIIANRLMLSASGSPQALTVRVGQGGKPVAGATVVITGPGIRRSGNTGSTGLFRTSVTPHSAGVLTVDLRGAEACRVRRIGLVAATTPPVTG